MLVHYSGCLQFSQTSLAAYTNLMLQQAGGAYNQATCSSSSSESSTAALMLMLQLTTLLLPKLTPSAAGLTALLEFCSAPLYITFFQHHAPPYEWCVTHHSAPHLGKAVAALLELCNTPL
jgi:hypothetical protein